MGKVRGTGVACACPSRYPEEPGEIHRERNSIVLSRFVRTRHAVPPFSQRAIHRVAAVQERQHWSAPHANPLESAADAISASVPPADKPRPDSNKAARGSLSFPALPGREFRRHRIAARRELRATRCRRDKTDSLAQYPERAGRGVKPPRDPRRANA